MSDKNTTYSKQVIEIADYIYKNPQYKTAKIIAVFCGKLQKSKRTIELYIKQAEGKSKMLVINNVIAKLLARVFAVINRGTPFVNTCKFAS